MSFYSIAASAPSVFAVEDSYFVCVPVRLECTMSVTAGDRTYYDHSNGVLRSSMPIHLVKVPMAELDAARGYTVTLRHLKERRSYFTDAGEACSESFDFRSVPAGKTEVNVMHIADSHSHTQSAIEQGRYFGEDLDILILNGDVLEDASDENRFLDPYLIAGGVTGGSRPCVFSRGNHDLRGRCAELFGQLTPSADGNCYYTFRLGPVGGIVLDCGEDKTDDHAEYGETICCHVFRREEERFLAEAVKRPGIADAPIRLVVSHCPFTQVFEPPFDLEQELYARWTHTLNGFKPLMLLSGHVHRFYLTRPGDDADSHGQTFPTMVASALEKAGDGAVVYPAAVILREDGADIYKVHGGRIEERYKI